MCVLLLCVAGTASLGFRNLVDSNNQRACTMILGSQVSFKGNLEKVICSSQLSHAPGKLLSGQQKRKYQAYSFWALGSLQNYNIICALLDDTVFLLILDDEEYVNKIEDTCY